FRGTRWERTAGYYRGPDAGERDGILTTPVNNPNLPGVTSEDDIIPVDMYYIHPTLLYWDMGWMSLNGRLDMGDGLPDFTGPPPPPIPALLHCVPNTANAAAHRGGQVLIPQAGDCHVGGLGYELKEDKVILRWSKHSSEDSSYRDPFSRRQDFEGYRIHCGNINEDGYYSLLGEFDKVNFAYFSTGYPLGTTVDSMMTFPVDSLTYDSLIRAGAQCDTFAGGVVGCLKQVGRNLGFGDIIMDDSTYQFEILAHKLAPRYYAVTAFDWGDPRSGLGPLTTRPTTNAVLLAPAGSAKEPVRVVPNPYRAYEDYTRPKLGVSWENMNDGTDEFYAQQDRRIEFINLPERCLIRIFTVAGDLVAIIPHNEIGDNSQWASLTSERWDLNSRNRQQVVSGIYLFSVEDLTDENAHEIETGKFVIIR
ncbi:hypothetical protein KKH27_02875, partial [bacterium]|nr:hypothetical protein [bacterium]MBU1983195.1 hypothetical protein [bacterium]